ncbi:MAG: polymer-forming cytoskeletal protein [Gammaproteobacteria bacterium AqS3]|nr:polymer-forming cytoskeletal protein [Gammaproteobacteria bacterium AqS3]
MSKDNRQNMDTLIGAGARIEGDINFEGSMYVHGLVIGNVVAAKSEGSQLVVAEGAHIKGGVRAATIVLHGTVEGNVEALETVEIAASGRVQGDLNYALLQVQPGAEVSGQLKRLDPEVLRKGGDSKLVGADGKQQPRSQGAPSAAGGRAEGGASDAGAGDKKA